MALTHINFEIVSRSQRDGNAVKASAYNAAAQFEHDGRVFDFTRKRSEHVGGGVLLPSGASADLHEPGALWRAAEAAERRSDAQVARQVLVSIPREVPHDRREALAREIAAPWVADGAAVQFDVHNPTAADGGEQPHVHYLLSMRRVSDKGFAAKKAREWNDQFREQDGRAERERISARANEFFAAHGISARLDPRTLAAQGDDHPPEPQAPRADWQQWKRQGADPESAPATVAAVLEHRGRRRSLAVAEAEAEAAAHEVADSARAAAGQPAAPNPARTPEIPKIAPVPEETTAREGRTGRTPEGGATFIPPKPAPKPDPWAECVAGWKADQAAAWQAEKAGREADRQAGRQSEAALREAHKSQRSRVFRDTRRSLVRDLSLAAADAAAQRDRVRLRAAHLVRALIRPPRATETLDDWIRRRAAAGDQAAQEVARRRQRAADRLAERDPAEAARRYAAAAREVAERVVASAPPDALTIRRSADEALARLQARADKAAAAAKTAHVAARVHARVHSLTGLGWIVIGRKAAADQTRLRTEAEAAARRSAWAAADYQADRQAARKALPAALREAERARAEWSRQPEVQAAWRTLAEPPHAPPQPSPGARPAAGSPEDPREAAVAALHAAEAQATTAAALAAARLATAAALAGDPDTIAAAAAGDPTAAQAAAAIWQRRCKAEAAEAARVRPPPRRAVGYGM